MTPVLIGPELHTEDDVRDWFHLLFARGFNFHPDDDFADSVVDATGLRNDALTAAVFGIAPGFRTFSDVEARMMNESMDHAHRICDDVYALGLDVMRERGLIP